MKEIFWRLWVKIVHPPTALDLAKRELENARRSFLENQTHSEYYSNLVKFEQGRITRLEKYIGESV